MAISGSGFKTSIGLRKGTTLVVPKSEPNPGASAPEVRHWTSAAKAALSSHRFGMAEAMPLQPLQSDFETACSVINHQGRTKRTAAKAGAVLAVLLGFCSIASAALEREKALLAQGEYAQAIGQLEKVLVVVPDDAEAAALLLQARLETGQYRQALEQGEQFLKRRSSPAVAEKTAEAALRLGKYERADAVLGSYSTPTANWLRGALAERKGQTEAARAAWQRVVNSDPADLSGEELGVVAEALASLGRFQQAHQLYRQAMEMAPKNAAIRAAWGNLLLRKHNPADAEGLFREALEINPNHTGALLGMAELAASRWEGQAAERLQNALQVHPNLAEARVLLARLHLEQDEHEAAAKELDAALQVNPRMLEAWSLQAVNEYLQGDETAVENQWLPRILKENPRFGKVFADLGDFSLLKRQYVIAVGFFRRAVKTDPDLAEARADLGINLLRLGKEQEARQALEEAYRQDPSNIWTVNTLRLMDSFSRFDSLQTEHFSGKLHQSESAVLRPYVEQLLEEALESLRKRYQYTPPDKVVFEMYPDHEDFAVRTVGLPGLGALGASFGPVVVMDSPSARPRGTFHWGSTLWHELAHVITLGITDYRVPRWFTEGLSVYEENNSRAGWGDPMTLDTVQALQKGQLIPLENLDTAFIRPKHPSQVAFAYFQAGMICEYIVEKYGFEKIIALLDAYGRKRSDAEAFREVLQVRLAEFDAQFLAYARERTYGFAEAVKLEGVRDGQPEAVLRAIPEASPNHYFSRLRLAQAALEKKQWQQAIAEAEAAKHLFPLYVDEGNPYEILAQAHLELGNKEQAVAELLLWKKTKGRNPKTFSQLATWLRELGRTDEAIQTLEDLLYIDPFDPKVHELLGDWYQETSAPRKAVREFAVLLGLDPPDRAGAHYRLAEAYHAIADMANARRQVLAALEIAPGYRPAQKLLLELSGK